MRLQATTAQKRMTILLATAVPVLLAAVLVPLLLRPSTPVFVWGLLLLPLALALAYAHVVTDVSLTGAGVVCKSLLRTTTVPLQDLRSIDMRPWNHGFITIRAVSATVFLYRGVPGAVAALKNLASGNPHVEVRE